MLEYITLGSFRLPSYFFLLCFSFIIALIPVLLNASKNSLSKKQCVLLVVVAFVAGIGGAKLFSMIHFVVTKGWSASSLKDLIILVQYSGFIAFGGFLLGPLALVITARFARIDLLKYLDAFAPWISLAIVFGRLGCLFGGCCWGVPSDSIISVQYPISCPAGEFQHAQHAAGLFPSPVFAMGLAFLTMLVILRYKKSSPQKGYPFFLFILLYAFSRFLVDITRDYSLDERFLTLSYNQWISIIVIVAVLLLVRLRRTKQ